MIAPVADNSILRQNEADSQSARLNRLAAGAGQRSFAGELEKAGTPASAHSKPRDEKLWNACVETESIFVARMLKEMRATVHKGDMLHGGQAEEIFEDMLYDQYALEMSKNANMGMAKMLYEQLSTIRR